MTNHSNDQSILYNPFLFTLIYSETVQHDQNFKTVIVIIVKMHVNLNIVQLNKISYHQLKGWNLKHQIYMLKSTNEEQEKKMSVKRHNSNIKIMIQPCIR